MTVAERTAAAPHERLGIVIVTYNRVQALTPTLERLRALEAPYPIVIVDNGSTDGTADAVRRVDPGILLVRMERNLGGGARNYGVRALDREFIAFADDDSWWTLGSLARAIELFDAHPRLALIMSRVLAGPEERLDPCCELMSRSPLPRPDGVPGVPILGFLACGVVLRRDAFLEAGGFEERFRTGGEEAIVAMELARNGWALSYIDELVTHHHPSPSRDVFAPRRGCLRRAVAGVDAPQPTAGTACCHARAAPVAVQLAASCWGPTGAVAVSTSRSAATPGPRLARSATGDARPSERRLLSVLATQAAGGGRSWRSRASSSRSSACGCWAGRVR